MGCCDGASVFDCFSRNVPQVRFCNILPPVDFAKIKVNLRETEDKVIVEAELPGFAKEDLCLLLVDTTLSISAEKQEHQKKEDGYLLRESSSAAKYQRSIYLPFQVDGDQIKAYYNAGVLRVDIPKPSQEEAAKNIEIS